MEFFGECMHFKHYETAILANAYIQYSRQQSRAAVCEHALLAILKQYYFLPYINIVTLNPTLNIPAFSFEAGETYTVADGENHTVVVCPVWRSGLCG